MPQSFSHYAVYRGITPGVYTTWAETELQTKGFKGGWQKGFYSYDEAKASFRAYEKNPVRHFPQAPNPQAMKGPLALTDSEGSAPPSPVKERRNTLQVPMQVPIPLRVPVK